MLNKADVIELVSDTLLPAFEAERLRLDVIDLWYRWKQELPVMPNGATREMKELRELARTPWLNLVVTGVAQNMWLDGYRSPDNNEDLTPWRSFTRNGLRSRQGAVHRAMLAYGRSYVTVLPGADPVTDDPMAVIRGVSPRNMLAFWADPVEDEYPMYSIRCIAQGDHWLIRVLDHEVEYHLSTEVGAGSNDRVIYLDARGHDVGVTPVVQFSNMLDLEGRTDGEVEPLIPLAARINKTDYDLLLIQHFNSWKVRTATGLAAPEDDELANLQQTLRHDSVLISDSHETKFSTLDETSPDGMIKAKESHVKTLAAVSQTAVHALTGDMINVSAEGLAASKAEAEAKCGERRMAAGESWNKVLRLGAFVDGDTDAASDTLATVTWADTSVRSLATAADALGKMATMLGVPPRALWSRIPGVTKTDVEEWKAMAAEDDPIAQFGAALERQADPAT